MPIDTAQSVLNQWRVLSSVVPGSAGVWLGAKNGKTFRNGNSFPLTLSPVVSAPLVMTASWISITSSCRRRPFGKPVPTVSPPPGPLLAMVVLKRKKSPLVTAE